jgi:hypothetical protein
MYHSFHLADTVCPTLPRLQIERPPVLTRHRPPLGLPAGPTEGLGIKRLSSSQAPASDDFPGRATRTLGRAKEAAEELLPGQPGKALENATRGLRLGRAVSDAGLNLNTTIAGERAKGA